MIQSRCPTCGKAYAIQTLDELPSFPFCTDRCRLVDLGRWIDGAFVIPGTDVPSSSPDETHAGELEEE